MKVTFHTKSSTDTIESSAWQDFLKGKMGKGKSLKELSVEFKKLNAEVKTEEETESKSATSLSIMKKKGPAALRESRKKADPAIAWSEDLKIRQEMLKLHNTIDAMHKKLNTTYSMKKLVSLLEEDGSLEKDEDGKGYNDGDKSVVRNHHIESDAKRLHSKDD